MSDLYSLMEYILQMAESLTTGLRHDSATTQTANSGHRLDPSKVADVTKMALRQLAIGIMIDLILILILQLDISSSCWKKLKTGSFVLSESRLIMSFLSKGLLANLNLQKVRWLFETLFGKIFYR